MPYVLLADAARHLVQGRLVRPRDEPCRPQVDDALDPSGSDRPARNVFVRRLDEDLGVAAVVVDEVDVEGALHVSSSDQTVSSSAALCGICGQPQGWGPAGAGSAGSGGGWGAARRAMMP